MDKISDETSCFALRNVLRDFGLSPLAAMLEESGHGTAVLEAFAQLASREIARQSPQRQALIDAVVSYLTSNPPAVEFERRAYVLLDCARYYQGIGRYSVAINVASALIPAIESPSQRPLKRRIYNALGAFYLDSALFQECLEHLDVALLLAADLSDDIGMGACLANSMSALKELGHYRDAISASSYVMRLPNTSASVLFLKFQCAGNGLFCAHRLQDPVWAMRFLEIGNNLLANPEIDIVSKATYEYYRAAYLVDTFDQETAEDLIAAAQRTLDPSKNPRVSILLCLSEALCEWAHRDEAGYQSSRLKLRDLYQVTKKSRLYHDDVLRALMKVYGNAIDQETAKLGMRYAKELVEYTTSVKRAKFYRQLSDRGVPLEPAPPELQQPFDPFANVRQWLAPTTEGLPEGQPTDAIHGPNAIKARVQKHEELAAIHEDLAKLRTEAILKEIRSVAYDTAENWALAAEFFDDQTGQHCFRVGHLAGMLARELGLENDYCARIEHAARLHDIGKIGINEMILLKPGPLDPSELTAMRAHAEVGAYMLQGAKDPVLQMAAVIAKHHHEWWNGAGYPSSLGDRSIPLAARICALADVYDALTHARPYKGAWPHRVAVEEMLNLSGVQFDPHMMRPFLRVLERYVPALADGRIPGLDQLRTNGLIASRKKLMETISGSKP